MGLGLAMIKNIIETYKGTITFTSTESEGSTFKVTLPKG
jgi:signal transduction histidine kinase